MGKGLGGVTGRLLGRLLSVCGPSSGTRRSLHCPAMADYPDTSAFASLVDLLDDAAQRYPHDRPTLSLRTDEGTSHAWSSAEIRRRARLAAWRLRALGLAPGDRLLTWSPSTPALPAVFWGAAIAGAVLVPARPAHVADRAPAHRGPLGRAHPGHRHRRRRARPGGAGLTGLDLELVTLDDLTADPVQDDRTFPTDWESQLDAWPRPTRDEPVRGHLHLGHDVPSPRA